MKKAQQGPGRFSKCAHEAEQRRLRREAAMSAEERAEADRRVQQLIRLFQRRRDG